MLTNVFENRNRYFANLVKLADFLGRSLRENVEVFSVEGDEITFITESNKVLKGTVSSANPNILQNIKVEDTSIFEDKDQFSKLVDKRVTKFLSNIIENDLIDAETSFDDVLKLWELRLQFDITKSKLTEKSERFKTTKITTSPEFQRVLEVKDQLISYLKKNSKVISNVNEIKNTVKLAYAISECFNLPKISYESLVESTYKIPGRVTQNLYEHLTKMELINKELNESKQDFNSIWSTNDLVVELVSMIYEKNESKIFESLAKVIHQVPYFALTSKKQLNETFRTVLNLLEQDYNDNQLKKFTSLIYESKKPVKNYLIDLLNEKYGVNVTNLTETPTFATLANTESLIFESLAVLSPKNSNMRRVLFEMSKLLKEKNGIETIDIADFLNEVFVKAEYTQFINETNLMNYLDFNKVADDLGKIGSVLKMIQGNISGAAPATGGRGADTMGQDIGGLSQALGGMGGQQEEMPEDQYGAEIDAPPEGEDDVAPAENMGDEAEAPAMDAEDAAQETMEEEMPPEEGMEEEVPSEEGMDGEEDMDDGEQPQAEDELLSNLKDLEDMIATLKSDLGVDNAEGEDAEAFGGEETPEEEAMEHGEMENEEEGDEGDGDVNIDADTSDDDADSDSDDDEVHIDIDSHKDEDEEGEEESEEEEDEDEEEKQEESSHKKLKGNQHRLDKNKNGKLDKQDFKMLRKGKK